MTVPKPKPKPPETTDVEVTVLTGLSGAGRSEAADALEDLGWFVVDNLPPALIRTMLQLALAPGNDIRRVALVIDARGGTFFDEAQKELEELRAEVANCRIVFFEASDDVLVRRFDANRRRHPLAMDDTVAAGIQRERELMMPLREAADLTIDTSTTSVHELRSKLAGYFSDAERPEGLKTTVVSFGFKFGIPLDADMVLDVRFIPNPHWVENLRPLDGRDPLVQRYVIEKEVTQRFLEKADEMLDVLMTGYQSEGRHYLTIAVGCTGGRHRSVVLAEQLAGLIKARGLGVKVVHRDVERAPVAP